MGAYNVVNRPALAAGQPEDISQVLANLDAIAAVLNGGIDNSNINVAAAIAYSKLALAGGIVNADINAGAAIAIAKLAGYPADATKALKGDGTWAAVTPPSPAFVAPPLTPNAVTNWGANTANYSRVYIPAPFTVTKFNVYIGAASGNMDVGIYSDAGGLPGARLWSRGAVASPGAGQQGFLISAGAPAALTLAAGTYWLAVAMDNAVQTIATIASGTLTIAASLLATQAAAYPLPANAAASILAQGVHSVLT